MSKCYLLFAEGLEECEGLITLDILRRAGLETYTVSVEDAHTVVGAHGVHGACKLEPWCDGIQTLKNVREVYTDPNGAHAYVLRSLKAHGKIMLLQLCEISTPEQAALLRGKVLYAARESLFLEKNHVFLQDMIGLPVFDATSGAQLGKLEDVLEYPASRIYRIATPSGDVLVPAVDTFVDRIDTESGIYLRPIAGMFGE